MMQKIHMIWTMMMISNLSYIPQIVLMVSNLDTRKPPLKIHKTGYENVIKEKLKKLSCE